MKVCRTAALVGAAALSLVGVWLIGGVALAGAKATLAPVLIESAWNRVQAGDTGDALKPWPWADMKPALKLSFPGQKRTLYALGDATARSMAFGPVLDRSTATPVLFGHRDSHFRFLERIIPGDIIITEGADGSSADYRIVETAVRHRDAIDIPVAAPGAYLVLVTCYPFDAATAGGAMRFVVLAERQDDGFSKL